MDNAAILESISDGVFTVDLDWRITYLNRSAERIIRIRRQDAVGRLCCDVFHSSLCEGNCALRRTLEQGEPMIDLACFIINNEGSSVPVSISTAALRDDAGRIVGGAETFRDLSVPDQLLRSFPDQSRLGGFTSHSASMQKIFSRLGAVAETSSTVLITGETGSGKELLAKTLHANSLRAEKPFVAINCGAFPDSLLESELFGYRKGAFTGADHDKPGRFARAEGGTLFLDEIGDISPAMQIRLLRVLQERVYEPLGAVKPEKTDVRIIAATNRNLPDLIKRGEFRQDLFYRINVISLELPPLRERREDIPFLIDLFIRNFNRHMSRRITGVSSSALKALCRADWPGNIRELENVIERSMVFCRTHMIELDDLPEELTGPTALARSGGAAASIDEAVRDSEARAILAALDASGGNRRKAAARLKIHPTTFYRKLKLLELNPPLRDGRTRVAPRD